MEQDTAVAVENADSIPESVKKLVKAVADDDKDGFSQLVSYPLQRPYPLHDIETPEQMSEYYHNLVDDSLRNVIIKAGVDKWSEYGWRGWSLDDGRYIWVDENVYDVNYISNSELRNIDSLQRVEIASLAPELREGWRPMMCLKSSDSGKIYRVDTRTTGKPEEINHYRLAVYGSGDDLAALPAQLLEGEMEVDGSAGSVSYHFHDKAAASDYILLPESTESIDPVIIKPSGDNVTLKRTYWHELVRKH
ncbi:MAG: hypothetical protein K2G67_07855 [Muribaculaceae bacterium]|nr:hypothetical protein [Muribaculaceae bacterium]